MRVTDVELHRRVLDELESEPSLREQEIGIALQGGVVTLSGYVGSYDQKRTAEQAVERVSGVQVVAEALRVRAPGPRTRNDTELAHTVAGHLRAHSGFPHESVKARVEDGHVTLEGEVELFHHRAAAEEGVDRLAGVRGVTNLITVRPPEFVDDIKSKIETALVWMAHVDSRLITVDAAKGQVILTGTVSSQTEEYEAVKAAGSVYGVTSVEDRLKVVA